MPHLIDLLSDDGSVARSDKAMLGYACRLLELVVPTRKTGAGTHARTYTR